MFELLSLIVGSVTRLGPELLKLVTAKRDAEHEFRMTELQLRIDRARAAQALDLMQAQGAIVQEAQELQAIVQAARDQGKLTGIAWIDGLSSSVRPVLTYWWCMVLYTAAKIVLVIGAWPVEMSALAALLLSDFDRSIVASIIGFWFTDRVLRRSK